MKRQKLRPRFSRRTRKILLISAIAALGVFVIGNLVLWAVYHNRTYPRTKVMHTAIGSVSYGNISARMTNLQLLPQDVELTHGQQKVTVPLKDLGISQDISRTTKSANKQRSWLPIINMFSAPELQAPIAINQSVFATKAKELAGTLRRDAINAQLALTNGTVNIAPAKNGYELNQALLAKALTTALDKGKDSVSIPTTVTQPTVQAQSLESAKAELEAQLKTSITYKYGGSAKQATAADIANWYVPLNGTYVASSDKIQAYATTVGAGFGIKVKDLAGVATSTQQALSKHQALSLTLTQQLALKSFSYCVAAKGVDAGHLPGMRAKLKETYGSSRGWSLGGLVEFKEVSSGCNFTVWLTAANLMPTFGDICDSMWSCRVGPNVVINFDRWQGASSSWNASGGTLDEYRHMVINHETGHWLSFGHSHCPAPGQPAPVMQQQSIDLQGCSFNAWPTAGELTTLQRSLGI